MRSDELLEEVVPVLLGLVRDRVALGLVELEPDLAFLGDGVDPTLQFVRIDLLALSEGDERGDLSLFVDRPSFANVAFDLEGDVDGG